MITNYQDKLNRACDIIVKALPYGIANCFERVVVVSAALQSSEPKTYFVLPPSFPFVEDKLSMALDYLNNKAVHYDPFIGEDYHVSLFKTFFTRTSNQKESAAEAALPVTAFLLAGDINKYDMFTRNIAVDASCLMEIIRAPQRTDSNEKKGALMKILDNILLMHGASLPDDSKKSIERIITKIKKGSIDKTDDNYLDKSLSTFMLYRSFIPRDENNDKDSGPANYLIYHIPASSFGAEATGGVIIGVRAEKRGNVYVGLNEAEIKYLKNLADKTLLHLVVNDMVEQKKQEASSDIFSSILDSFSHDAARPAKLISHVLLSNWTYKETLAKYLNSALLKRLSTYSSLIDFGALVGSASRDKIIDNILKNQKRQIASDGSRTLEEIWYEEVVNVVLNVFMNDRFCNIRNVLWPDIKDKGIGRYVETLPFDLSQIKTEGGVPSFIKEIQNTKVKISYSQYNMDNIILKLPARLSSDGGANVYPRISTSLHFLLNEFLTNIFKHELNPDYKIIEDENIKIEIALEVSRDIINKCYNVKCKVSPPSVSHDKYMKDKTIIAENKNGRGLISIESVLKSILATIPHRETIEYESEAAGYKSIKKLMPMCYVENNYSVWEIDSINRSYVIEEEAYERA